jgi:hypothetical protein
LRNTGALGLCVTTRSSVESAEWHSALVRDDVPKESLGVLETHVLDSLGSLARVLRNKINK